MCLRKLVVGKQEIMKHKVGKAIKELIIIIIIEIIKETQAGIRNFYKEECLIRIGQNLDKQLVYLKLIKYVRNELT